jgi:hypothetical protein
VIVLDDEVIEMSNNWSFPSKVLEVNSDVPNSSYDALKVIFKGTPRLRSN